MSTYQGPRSFHAKNHDPRVKAQAETVARQLTADTGIRYTVRYFDDYNDYSVSGSFDVRPV